MSKVILVCTVGSSPEPIRVSIRENKPGRSYLYLFRKRPDNREVGSYDQIQGDASSIKEQLDNTHYSIKKGFRRIIWKRRLG